MGDIERAGAAEVQKSSAFVGLAVVIGVRAGDHIGETVAIDVTRPIDVDAQLGSRLIGFQLRIGGRVEGPGAAKIDKPAPS